MSGPWVDLLTLKRTVPILDVLQRYKVRLRRAGEERIGPCPIHKGEGQDCFRVNPSKRVFHCFSCGAKGNVLDLVMAMEKCSVRDAALKLQEWFGLASGKAPTAGGTSAPATGSELAREERAGEENRSADDEGVKENEKVPNNPLGFQLQGIDSGHHYLVERGISRETAEYFGVGFFPGKGSMHGRVVIPIHNEGGVLVGYIGRSIDGTEPRYKLPERFRKSMEVFNLHRVKAAYQQFDRRGVIVVEGFFDAMKVHQAGYPWVVALMGCSMSEEQERLLVANADMALIMLDGDPAGQRGTGEMAVRLGRHIWVKRVALPEDKQPDQLSSEELGEVLRSAGNWSAARIKAVTE